MTGGVASRRDVLCPPPLFIQKKSRRSTFRRRILRKSYQSQNSDQYVLGPLDDIIDEIECNIWGSSPSYCFDSSVLDWAKPLKTPSTWVVTPLPVSRNPSDQPLTVRKNRNSRSSTSGSSFGDVMAYSRSNSQDEPVDGGSLGTPLSTTLTPWPLLDPTMPYEPVPMPRSLTSVIGTGSSAAQQALNNVIQSAEDRSEPPKRRASRLRLFTNGFPRLRRTGTGETKEQISETSSPTTAASLATQDEVDDSPDTNDPSDEAVEAYMKRIARDGAKFGSILGRITRQFPPPAEHEHEATEAHLLGGNSSMPTTLRAAVRVFPETKILSKNIQDISIAVDIEGVLHNRKSLPNAAIDVIFVVDNGYYVTSACLDEALAAVNGALYHLSRGDRVALYTTHCTHHAVTGNRPDLHFPMRPYCFNTDETFRELTARIAKCGTQVWEPPRPNPAMTEVILSIARSIDGNHLKTGRTQVILLSPAAHSLHDVSSHFPDLYIHRINPAILPYRRDLEMEVCNEDCCKNVFVSNWSNYQSVPGRIKRILKFARCEKPIGELTELTLDVRTKPGCELIECYGNKDIPRLRLGQFHTFFARIRVTRSATQAVDLDSINPVFNSSLEFKGLRQEVLNAVALGATKVHLFDVQVYHQNTLHSRECWNYKEAPLFILRELGGLAPPIDASLEISKRHIFHMLTTEPKAEIHLESFDHISKHATQFFECMARERECHQAIQAYELKYRHKLPLCPGPIDIEASAHEWLVDLWNRKKIKRKGVTVAQGEDITSLTSGLERLD